MKYPVETSKVAGLIIIVLLSFSLLSCTAGGDRKVSLRGNWKFALGDNMNFAKPTYNDSGWEKIYVPSSWQDEGFRHYSGYAWYRKTFSIEFDKNEPLFVELGRIDDVDEVYINGHLIGSSGGFPPEYFTAYNIDRIYLIPTEYLLNQKDNVIAVRIYDEGGEGGILGGGNIGIYSDGGYSENGFSLLGNWKFHLFDNEDWSKEDYDDSGWENIIVPSSWEAQGFKEYDGFGWYRKTFTLPAKFEQNDMVIILGKIDDMDEVFINGERIGGTGRIDRKWARDGEWNKPRTYFIPNGLLRAGRPNLVAVRVYDQEQRGGIYEGPVTILPRSEYKMFWKKHRNENYYFGWNLFSYFD